MASRSATGDVCVASVASGPVDSWSEVPVDGLFVLSLANPAQPSVHHLPWREGPPFEQSWWWTTPVAEAPARQRSDMVEEFAQVLSAAVARRVAVAAGPEGPQGSARVGLLFSGGLDSTALAALAVEALPAGEPLELLNVAFDRAAPDRLTALFSFAELVERYGASRFRLILADVREEEVRQHEPDICRMLGPQATHLDFNIAAALWFAARGIGEVCSPSFCQQEWWLRLQQDPSHVAALQLEEGDNGPKLKAAAPEPGSVRCPACRKQPAKPGCANSMCKLCCRKALQATAAGGPVRCAAHKIRGGGEAEVAAAAAELATEPPVLDLSSERCRSPGAEEGARPPAAVRAAARVLLVGSGADELLGGYGRHRTAKAHRGAEGARGEMMKDLQRLWTRNLGRDDRIVADHGREARHPFLDDGVLNYVGSLPIELLAFGPAGADPVPDKWMLRDFAASRGLGACARFKKRAIQFGSRIAKQSNVWHAGSNRQVRGDMAYRALHQEGGEFERCPRG
ncbi:unnamed protein product [Prorocentrum cordatum]|nr:unnamed protein product [Polarella glacialis]